MRKKREKPHLSDSKKRNIALFAILGVSSFQCICQLVIICKSIKSKSTSISTEPSVEQDVDLPAQKGGFAEDFKSIFLLIISLLHGTLFFFLCEKTINLVQDYSKIELSILCLQIAMYFRIIQTHLLAAIKYSENWSIKSFDFLLVFLTAFFEYILIHIDTLGGEITISTSVAILIFSLYGVFGYFISLQRVKQRISNRSIKKVEMKIQGINIFVLLVVSVLYTVVILCADNFFTLANFITAMLLFVNIYTSMHYSKYAFK